VSLLLLQAPAIIQSGRSAAQLLRVSVGQQWPHDVCAYVRAAMACCYSSSSEEHIEYIRSVAFSIVLSVPFFSFFFPFFKCFCFTRDRSICADWRLYVSNTHVFISIDFESAI
jgi:hypothetical protein